MKTEHDITERITHLEGRLDKVDVEGEIAMLEDIQSIIELAASSKRALKATLLKAVKTDNLKYARMLIWALE